MKPVMTEEVQAETGEPEKAPEVPSLPHESWLGQDCQTVFVLIRVLQFLLSFSFGEVFWKQVGSFQTKLHVEDQCELMY